MTPRHGTRGCREESGQGPAASSSAPPSSRHAGGTRARFEKRTGGPPAGLFDMSNKHDGSAGGFGRSTERGAKGPRSQTERGKTRSSVVTQGAEAVPELCSRLSKLPRNSGLHLTILPHRSNEVLARREKAGPKACSPTKRSEGARARHQRREVVERGAGGLNAPR